MLGTILNAILMPFYFLTIIIVVALTTITRILSSISIVLGHVADFLGEVVVKTTKACSRLD